MSGGHVFISYSHKDRDYVSRLVKHTEALGFQVYWDGQLEVGGRWHRELMDKVRTCAAFVLVMTPNSEQSERVENEMIVADESEGVTIIPIQCDGHRFDYLRSRQSIAVEAGVLPGDDYRSRLDAAVGSTEAPGSGSPGSGVEGQSQPDSMFSDGLPADGPGADASDYDEYVTDADTRHAARLTAEGRKLAEQLKPSDAAAKFDQALDLVPDFVPALVNQASLACGLKDWATALASADRAVAADAGQPFAHGNRAMALVGQRRLPEARAAIETAIALDPGNVRSHWMHGGILADLGDYDEALAAYDRALDISPDLKPLQTVRKLVVARKWASKVGLGRRRRR